MDNLPDPEEVVKAYKLLQGVGADRVKNVMSKPTPTAVPEDLGYVRRLLGQGMVKQCNWDRRQVGQASELGPLYAESRAEGCPKLDYSGWVGYKSGSGTTMSLLVQGITIPRDSIPLLTAYETFASCKDCKGSNGGCPGFAPPFSILKPEIHSLFVVVVHFDIAWTFTHCTPGVGKAAGRLVRQLTYADRLTETYCNRLRSGLAKMGGGYALSMGNCEGCGPKSCAVLYGKSCKKPGKRTYSMESVGIDCDALHYALFGEFLPWYYRGMSGTMPTYFSRYFAFFCNPGFDYPNRLRDVAMSDKSYIPVADVDKPVEAKRAWITVPMGVHKGYVQRIYIDPGVPIEEGAANVHEG